MTNQKISPILTGALSLLLTAATITTATSPPAYADGEPHAEGIRHVLLVSIDGMHAVDYLNCSHGIKSINGGEPYCPNLAELGETAVNYLDTSTSRPSDSFPGLTAIISGSSPRTAGAYYDVAYDRVLAPPTITTGNGVAGGTCTPGVPNGTRTEYEEGIDKNQQFVNGIDGISTANGDGGINSIDPMKLIRDPNNNCNPVYPWNFVRTNTIFGVAHAAGLYTAWADKHPAYASVSGPGNGKNVDDFYGPEINSNVVGLPGVTTVTGVDCSSVRDSLQTGAWTDSFQNIECYDSLKVNAVLNQIEGFTHNRKSKAPTPAIFGMNFQTVSVGQKLIERDPVSKVVVATGGYLDSTGTPSAPLLDEIVFTDKAIGAWVAELKKRGLYDSTLIIITAKHGQSPIDSARYLGISNSPGDPVTTSPATILDNAGCLPLSEAPSNPNGIGPTEDDVSLLWLNGSANCTTAAAVSMLRSMSPTANNVAGIGEIFSDRLLTTYFNKPGIPPNGDPRTPDIVVTPNIGVTYSGSTAKLAEHGGFSRDDTNVMLLVSHPSIARKTITSPVETMQVAPTVLKALGLNPSALDGVRLEGTQALPAVQFED
ncbi:MAG TPA: alkaline phosphatase family protein [Steroidobacteraceae bacterium]|nr:alkaline phosphatase family protein [Steroidobacteraceae bacterium]